MADKTTLSCPRCKGAGRVTLQPGLGPLLRYTREISGKTLWQVSDLSGLSRTHLEYLENGRSRNPRMKTIAGLVNGYGLSAGEMFAAIEKSDAD
jgi:transcriptional regulator with XRE-family HTH domain